MTQIRAVLHVISTEGRNLELVDVSINHLLYFMGLFFHYDTASFAGMTETGGASH
jgi:hypothetical protein